MSCIFLLTPVLIAAGGFPVVCAAAVTAASALGYRRLARAGVYAEAETEVEVAMENCEAVAGSLREDEKLLMSKGAVTVEFYKDARGRFAVHVRGRNVGRQELQRAGEELVGRVRQQLVYQKLMTEMEKRGYKMATESVGEDRRIRIKLERG